MARLTWDDQGTRLYETGVEKGVFYAAGAHGEYTNGVAWNGLISITESPSGAEATALYADDIKYLNLMSTEEFGATVEAYTYPVPFGLAIGYSSPVAGLNLGQQERKKFGMSYVTRVGNDIYHDDYAYKIHLLYGAKASPSDSEYGTEDDSPDAITFSWELSTEPVLVDGHKPTSTLVLDSRAFKKAGATSALHQIEDILYGGIEGEPARLPTPNDIREVINYQVVLRDSNGNAILDHDGNEVKTQVFA